MEIRTFPKREHQIQADLTLHEALLIADALEIINPEDGSEEARALAIRFIAMVERVA
jgi:hypothetical protein